jgi:hypothetical protein
VKFVFYMVEDPAAVDQEFYYLKKSDAFKHAKNVCAQGNRTKVVEYEVHLGPGKEFRQMLVNLVNRQNWSAKVTPLRKYEPGRQSALSKKHAVKMTRMGS